MIGIDTEFATRFSHGNVVARVGIQYVAIDSASGGYPYLVDDLKAANIWTSLDDATDYLLRVKEYANVSYAKLIVISKVTIQGKEYDLNTLIQQNDAYERDLKELKRKYGKNVY